LKRAGLTHPCCQHRAADWRQPHFAGAFQRDKGLAVLNRLPRILNQIAVFRSDHRPTALTHGDDSLPMKRDRHDIGCDQRHIGQRQQAVWRCRLQILPNRTLVIVEPVGRLTQRSARRNLIRRIESLA